MGNLIKDTLSAWSLIESLNPLEIKSLDEKIKKEFYVIGDRERIKTLEYYDVINKEVNM